MEHIPLPEFSTYVFFTVLSLLFSLVRSAWTYYVVSCNGGLVIFSSKFLNLLSFFIEDPCFFWNIVNCAYCILICIGRKLQRKFFGQLRDNEHVNVRENMLNFIFHKVVFLYGIWNVEEFYELILWTSWFTLIGFLHLLTCLAKERFEFIIQAGDTSIFPTRMLVLLVSLLLVNVKLITISSFVGMTYSIHAMCFMLPDVFLSTIRAAFAIAWYAVLLYCESLGCKTDSDVSYLTYSSSHYTRLVFSSLLDCVDLAHSLHLLLWNGLRFNMCAIIIGTHLHHLYHQLSSRIKEHNRFRKLTELLSSQLYFISLPDEDCSICWSRLIDARKLPCTHAFHVACLHMWLERSPDCPICRYRFDGTLQASVSGLEPSVSSPSFQSCPTDRRHNDNATTTSDLTSAEVSENSPPHSTPGYSCTDLITSTHNAEKKGRRKASRNKQFLKCKCADHRASADPGNIDTSML